MISVASRRRLVWHDERIFALLCLTPALLLTAALFTYPLARLLLLSVAAPNWSLENYSRIALTAIYPRVLLNTITLAIEVTLICVLLGYPLAYIMTRMRPSRIPVVVGLLLLPLWTSILVRSYAWFIILSPNGVINSLLLNLGLIRQPLHLIFNPIGVLIGMSHVLLPFAVLPLFSGMRAIDWRLILAAQSLGARRTQVFLRVFFPLSLPSVVGASLLVFIQAAGFYITPALLGGGRTIVLSMLIEQQISEVLNWGFGSALATVLMTVTILVLVIYQRVLGRSFAGSGVSQWRRG